MEARYQDLQLLIVWYYAISSMKTALKILFLLFICYILPPLAYGQAAGIDTPTVYDINDKNAVNGDILIYNSKGISRATTSFSKEILGVLQDTPIIVYRNLDQSGKAVMRGGNAQVNVTTINNTIKAGDYITSSEIAGKGQKATESGYVLGIALTDFQEEGKTTFNGQQIATGTVVVAIRIEYAEITNTRSFLRLLDYFNTLAFRSAQDPERASQLIKFLTAGAIAIGSVLLSFMVFAKSITKSIEAIGRNPLAKRAIQISIIINAGLTILTILLGMGAAYLILRA